METKKRHSKFDNYFKASASRKSVCWTCVLRFVGRNCQNLCIQKKGDRVIHFLFDILMKYDCSDKSVFYEILEYYFQCHFHSCECVDHGAGDDYTIDTHIMKPFLTLRRSNQDKPLSSMNIETFPTCLADFKLLLIFSNYGIHIGRTVFNFVNARNLLQNFLFNSQKHVRILLHFPEEFSYVMGVVLEDFKKTQGQLPYSGKQRGMRYIYLMVWNLHALDESLEKNPVAENIIKCLNVFYRTVPDPYISQEDMLEFFQVLWRKLPFELDSLAFVTSVYLLLFKNENPKLYCPRSLKHLCRISLRHTLRRNLKVLPQSVKGLHIPKNLHDYLLCKEPIHLK